MVVPKSTVRTVPSLDSMEVVVTQTSRQFPRHLHDTFVIQLVDSGADSCEISGLTATENSVFVHAPNVAHTGGPMDGAQLNYRAIYPSDAVVNELLGRSGRNAIGRGSYVLRSEELQTDMTSLFETLDKGSVHVHGNGLVDILRRIVRRIDNLGVDALSAANPRWNRGLAIACRDHLIEHCRRDVQIAELAEVTGASQFHLIRTFRNATGITPRQFLISQRVILAKRLLLAGMPIVEVAHRVGFCDQSHLTRCFKRVTGFSPGQFVKS